MRLGQMYNYGAWVIICIAMIMGALGDKRVRQVFGYWNAFLSCIVAAFVALFISVTADQILYRVVDSSLAEKSKTFQLEQAYENLNKMKFFSDADKEKLISSIEKMDPKEIYSFTSYLTQIVMYTLLNGLWGFIIAAFVKRNSKDELLNELMDSER